MIRKVSFRFTGLEVLEKLHANSDDPQHVGAKEEFVQIQTQLALERGSPSPNMFQLIFDRRYRKRMFYGFYLQAMCQSTGVLVIANYMVLELNNLGVAGSMPLLLLAVYNSWAAILNYVNALLIDRIGRIRIITIGITGCIFCLSVVTALNSHYGTAGNPNKAGQAVAVLFMFLFVTFYGFGIDVSSYVYCSEIFPTHIRSKGVGWSVSGLFLMTTIYTTAAGPAFNTIGWRFYLVFIVVTSLMLPFVVLYFPETKGLSLEEVGALFGDELAMDVTHLSEKEREELDADIAKTTDLTHFDLEKARHGAKTGSPTWNTSGTDIEHVEKVAGGHM
ncbi:hypothetical protein LTR28_013077 [Elasticomyces elasticus]|nr:hypothetical protein LTR28_013077 [Elasticomyces elasticus]